MTTALQNLAALQQLFAPVGGQIASANLPQLQIAQMDMRRRQALEDIAREQMALRDRDAAATNRAVMLANLQADREDARLNAYETRQRADLDAREKAASKTDAEALRSRIRGAYSEYKQRGGKKKLTELGDIAADDLSALSDLAAALADEIGMIQVEAEDQEVKALANLRAQASRAVDAASQLDKLDIEDAESRALMSLTTLDEDDKKKFYRDAARIGNAGALANLKPEVQREYQTARMMALRGIQQEKSQGKDTLKALDNLRAIDTKLIEITGRNPRLGRLFAETMQQSVAPAPQAGRAEPSAVFGPKTNPGANPPSPVNSPPVLTNLGQPTFGGDAMSGGAYQAGSAVGGALKSAGQSVGNFFKGDPFSGFNNLGQNIRADAQRRAEDEILSAQPYSPEAQEIRRRRGVAPLIPVPAPIIQVPPPMSSTPPMAAGTVPLINLR